MILDNFLTTAQVCKLCKCEESTAQKWAKTHGVDTIGDGTKRPLAFLWSSEKLAEFQNRPKPGRRWNNHKQKDDNKEGNIQN
jgi:hypothetical protein